MQLVSELQPSIRVAHLYDFPKGNNEFESTRIGYCYAFHLIKSGKGKIAVQGRTFHVRKGDLLYFPPRVCHSFYSDPEQPLSSYNIYCELWSPVPIATQQHLVWDAADFNSSFLTEMKEDAAIERLPNYVPLQHHETTVSLFEHIVNQFQSPHLLSDEIVRCLLKAFVLEIIQLSATPLLTDYRIKPIMDLIDQEANAERHYEAWLELSGLKKTQFHALFKNATGLSPKAYWTRAIMKQAAAALRESNRSITELAYGLGYSSIHHFTKQFTGYYGVAPSVFRNRKE
ncbi:AraC family transcriptional regulator [Cohnella endophytica]|uniref:AraC family transcriptional regulator n=1 Tax=Cohnella endophytica TaxID=2419778 RepID=A0A494YBK9_9BACL|nr:AraC family transcriptional regulator [Cohnella endophytica]RKP57342.1 AraC family transcriptional regulator [Cohnella endophytica]